MTLVKRFQIYGHTVSVFQGQCCGVSVAAVLDGANGALVVEISPPEGAERPILRYLRNEGILEAVVSSSGFLEERPSV